MKKIVGIVGAAAVLASSIFAVDFAADVHLNGSLFDFETGNYAEYGDQTTKKFEKANIKGPSVNGTNQKDTDGLIFSVNGDKAGAQVQFFYEAGKEAAVNARNVKIWFKPIDQVKISIGQVSGNFYVDRLTWWKAVSACTFKDTWHTYSGYASKAAVDGWGLLAEINPISALTIQLGFAPGAGSPFFSATNAYDLVTKDNTATTTMGAWGIGAKYQITDQISAAVSWADDGATTTKVGSADAKTVNNAKMLKIGGDFGNWGTPYYFMLNTILRFEEFTAKGAKDPALGLAGIGIDNYFKYNLNALTLEGRFPVVIRLANTGDKAREEDPSYFIFDVKATYALDAFNVYLRAGNDVDGASGYTKLPFGSEKEYKTGDCFNMIVKPGVTFNVGSCAFDLGLAVNVLPAAYAESDVDKKVTASHPINISVPFNAEIKF